MVLAKECQGFLSAMYHAKRLSTFDAYEYDTSTLQKLFPGTTQTIHRIPCEYLWECLPAIANKYIEKAPFELDQHMKKKILEDFPVWVMQVLAQVNVHCPRTTGRP